MSEYSVEILKISSNPALPLEEKARLVNEILSKLLGELETILFFTENVIQEILSRMI